MKLAALAALPILLLAPAPASADVAPYSLTVEVAFPEGAPSPTLEQEVVRRLLEVLSRRACYKSVQAMPADGSAPSTDLLLHIEFREIQDETNYDDSLAGFTNPDDPDAKLRFTLVLSVQVAETLAALPGGVEVTHQRFRGQATRRPVFHGEDVRREAKEDLLHQIATRVASFACGAPRKKTQRAVEAANPPGH